MKKEICEISADVVSRAGFFGGTNKFYVVVRNVTTGAEIEKTSVIEFRHDNFPLQANQQVYDIANRLLTDGWEIIGKEEFLSGYQLFTGGIMRFTRSVTDQPTRSSGKDAPDSELLAAAWLLRNAGVLEPNEFEKVMQRMQNRS